MPLKLYADNETYQSILGWGENNSNEWYHPISRSELTQGFHTLNAGDRIEFILDGVSHEVEVVKKVDRSEYGRLKYVRGELSVSSKKVEVVICLRKCVCVCSV